MALQLFINETKSVLYNYICVFIAMNFTHVRLCLIYFIFDVLNERETHLSRCEFDL